MRAFRASGADEDGGGSGMPLIQTPMEGSLHTAPDDGVQPSGPAQETPPTLAKDKTSIEDETLQQDVPERTGPRRRRFLSDRRFQGAGIDGLHSKEFEVDLLCGERIQGEPIRVRLTRTMSFWRYTLLSIITLGLYVLWTQCFAAGSHVFDVDARLAITSRGRLLLWTHTATGGGLSCVQHFCIALRKPSGFCTLLTLMVFMILGPLIFELAVLQVAAGTIVVLFILITVLFLHWMFERASIMASTTVRQFDACDLSCVRMHCYSYKSLFGFGGEVTSCHVQMFFGTYPKPSDLRKSMPWNAFDTGSVVPSPVIGRAKENMGGKLTEAAGQGITSENSFTSFAAGTLILLAFAAFLNEMGDFVAGIFRCIQEHPGASFALISDCSGDNFKEWWIGWKTAGVQSVLSHWIDAFDWSIQLVLFFYVVGPAAGMLWKTVTHQSSAGLGFIVDRTGGTAVEDEKFEEHFIEVTDFLTELFQIGSPDTPEAVGRLPPQGYVGGNDLGQWSEEIDGNLNDSQSESRPSNTGLPYVGGRDRSNDNAGSSRRALHRPRASWAQVEEMTRQLLEPFTSRVRVYKGVLAWLKDERLLAVYPEKARITCVVYVKAIITCGLDYFLHYRRQRREGALVLTDRRLMQVSAHNSLTQRSLKVDMYAIGGFVKYLSFNPPRRRCIELCCSSPPGCVSLASKCGTLEVVFQRLRRNQDCAQQFWQGLTLLQDAPPLTSQEFDSFATAQSGGWDPMLDGELEDMIRAEEALQDAVAAWGRPSNMGTRPSIGSRKTPPSLQRLSFLRPSLASRRTANNNAGMGDSLAANQGGEADVLSWGVRNEPWGLVLDEGEIALWGPTLFEEEIWRPWCCPNSRKGFRAPKTLVTITTRRLAVVQFENWGPLACCGICYYSRIRSVSVVPLRWVLGFYIAEEFSLRKAMLTRFVGNLCCWPNNVSRLTVKILTNAGLGKVYLSSLYVTQQSLPRGATPQSAFEEDKVLELRRWLGNVALFFVNPDNPKQAPIELWHCAHGLAPN